jgi:hypothetical protein
MSRVGPALVSRWEDEVFSPGIVAEIAASACPNIAVVGDLRSAASRLNEVANRLVFAAASNPQASAERDWAEKLAVAARTFDQALGPGPESRAALKLQLYQLYGLAEITAMRAAVRKVHRAALAYSVSASKQIQPNRTPKLAFDIWLSEMQSVYQEIFGRDAGVVLNSAGQRDGPAPRFIAAVAKRLVSDADLRQSPTVHKFLNGLGAAKAARAIQTLREKAQKEGTGN